MKNNLEDRCPHWDEKGDKYYHECWIAPFHMPCSGNPEGGYKACELYLKHTCIDKEKVRKETQEQQKEDAAFDKFLEEYNQKKCHTKDT